MSKPKKPTNPPVPVDPPPPEAGQAPPPSGVVSVSATKIEAFVGPLPHPDLLEKYEQIHPGAAGIVLNHSKT
jgi:hypothetical protein